MTVGFEVHPHTWTRSGRGVIEASDALASAVDRTLCPALVAAGACWGSDDIGRAFFNGDGRSPGFGKVRDALLADLADMVNLLRATGGMLIVSGRRYYEAETASNAGSALPPGADRGALAAERPYRLPEMTERLVRSDPPPPTVERVLPLLERLTAGCPWPDGDMASLAALRDAFTKTARSVTEVAQEVDGHSRTVTANNIGQATRRFASFAEALQGGGQFEGLLWLASTCQSLAGSIDVLIRQKKAARLQFTLSCTFIICTWLLAAALAPITAGESTAEATAVTRTAGLTLKSFLVKTAKAVAAGMWFGGGMDAIAQYARIHEGLQKGFKGGEFFKAVGEGGLAGAIMGGASSWVTMRGNRFTTTLADWTGARGFKGVGSRFVFAGTTGTVGNLAGQLTFEGRRHVDLAKAAEFGFGMAGLSAAGDFGRYVAGRVRNGRAVETTGGRPEETPPPADRPDRDPPDRDPRDRDRPDTDPPDLDGTAASERPGETAPRTDRPADQTVSSRPEQRPAEAPRTDQAAPMAAGGRPRGSHDPSGGSTDVAAGHETAPSEGTASPANGGAGDIHALLNRPTGHPGAPAHGTTPSGEGAVGPAMAGPGGRAAASTGGNGPGTPVGRTTATEGPLGRGESPRPPAEPSTGEPSNASTADRPHTGRTETPPPATGPRTEAIPLGLRKPSGLDAPHVTLSGHGYEDVTAFLPSTTDAPRTLERPGTDVGDRDLAEIRERDSRIKEFLDGLDRAEPDPATVRRLLRMLPPEVAGNARNARIVDEAVRAAALLLDHVRNRYGTPEAPRLHHAPVWPETPHTQHNTQHSERVADGAIRYAERARWAAPFAPITRAGLRVDAAASMRATIEGRGDGVAFADLPPQRPFSDLEMILNIPAGAGHDLLQGYGRGRDESFSAAVTREVMRRIMTETYTPGAGKYVYDSIQATTFHDTLKTQDYYGRPVPVAVGDLILLNEREGPEDGVDLSVEVLAKPDPIGLWPEFQKICRRAGLDLHTTTMPVYLETIENNPVLREAFVKHAKGQVWFFTNHQDIDVRNRDWFPGRQNNIRVLQALVPRLETRDLTVPEYRRILQDYAAGRISVRQVERMFPVPAPS